MVKFIGIANASAALALDSDHFIVADDEENFLSVFRYDDKSAAEAVSLRKILKEYFKRELDLEGGAAIGGRIFWITSHGTDKRGEPESDRQLLFAIEREQGRADFDFSLAGEVCKTLLYDLYADPAYRDVLNMPASLHIPPKEPGGLNIEGLAASPEGHLLIGFRNPLYRDQAVVATITNPDRLLKGHLPVLAPPMLVDLSRRGIRSMEEVGNGYLIVGGPIHKETTSELFHWSGKPGDAPVSLSERFDGGFNPEAVFVTTDKRTLWILSDDGRRDQGKVKFRAESFDLQTVLRDV